MKFDLDKVPSTLDQAVEMIYDALEPEDIQYIEVHGTTGTHFGAGIWIRNNWSLWDRECILAKWFGNNLGIGHADDMSGIILAALVCRVKGESFNLQAEAERYRQHWRQLNIDPLTQESLNKK